MLMLSRRHGDNLAGVKFYVQEGGTPPTKLTPLVGLGINSNTSTSNLATPIVRGRSPSPHSPARKLYEDQQEALTALERGRSPWDGTERGVSRERPKDLQRATSNGPQINITGPMSAQGTPGALHIDTRMDEVRPRIPIHSSNGVGKKTPSHSKNASLDLPIHPSPGGENTLPYPDSPIFEKSPPLSMPAEPTSIPRKATPQNVAAKTFGEMHKQRTMAVEPPRRKGRKNESVDLDAPSFQRVGTHIVDFDHPRISPFEERRGFEDLKAESRDNLVPLRKPPPPPSVDPSNQRTSPSLSYRKPVDSKNRDPNKPTRRRSVNQSKDPLINPEMSEKAGRRKAVQVDARSASGIAASLASAGLQGAGIGLAMQGKKLGLSRTNTESSGNSNPTPNQSSLPPLILGRAMATVNFNEVGGGSPGKGGSPSSPGFTWGKGNMLFKIPDYSQEASPETIDGNTTSFLRPDSMYSGGISPAVSPGAEAPPPVPLPFKAPEFHDHEITFTSTPTKPGNDDSDEDSDDDLFTIPITRESKDSGTGAPTDEVEPKIVEPSKTDDNSDDDSDDDFFQVPIERRNPSPEKTHSSEAKDTETVDKPAQRKTVGFGSKDSFISPVASSAVTPGAETQSSLTSPFSEYQLGEGLNTVPSPSKSRHPRPDSFNPDDIAVWASRPPAETLVHHLDAFFPDIDLDQPIIEEHPLESAIIEENSPPASPLPGGNHQATNIGALGRRQRGHEPQMATAAEILRGTAERSMGRQGLGRMKSIRETFRDAHDMRRRTPSVISGTQAGRNIPTNTVMRRKSTKMFGAKLVELTPGLHAKRMAATAAASSSLDNRTSIKRQGKL